MFWSTSPLFSTSHCLPIQGDDLLQNDFRRVITSLCSGDWKLFEAFLGIEEEEVYIYWKQLQSFYCSRPWNTCGTSNTAHRSLWLSSAILLQLGV